MARSPNLVHDSARAWFFPAGALALTMIFLLQVIPVSAVWDDTTGTIWVTQGDMVSLGEHTIKVIDASVDEGVPFIEVRRRSNVLYKGFIELDKPVEIKDEVLVQYLGSTQRFHYGPQIKLRAYQWVDGRITSVRFPQYMNREAFYNAWLEVANTGVKDAVFRTELTQAGKYDAKSGRYIMPDGTTKAILLDLQFPVQDVRIPYGVTERVAYNYVAPNRRQQSLLGDAEVRAGNSIEKSGDVVYRLFFKDQLLDEVTIPNVGYGKSPSGYIDDIDLPDLMVRNELYESKATITNAGPGGNNIDTGKLNLQLMTKGFTLGLSSNKLKKTPELQVSDDLLRKGMLTGEKNVWRFTITANVPAGEYELEFRLWQNRHDYLYSTYDVFRKRITVLENFNKLITKVDLPPSVEVGSQIPLSVTLNNVGIGKLINLNVRAPSLLDGPVKRVMTIPADSYMVVDYQIPAMVSGDAPISVDVYEHKASNYKWNDPYSEVGYALDSMTKTVHVLGEEEGPGLPPLPLEELPPQRSASAEGVGKPVSPSQVVVSTPGVPDPAALPDEAAPVPAEGGVEGVSDPYVAPAAVPAQKTSPVTVKASQPAMILLGVVILIIVLLAVRVVLNHYGRKRRLESHEAVSEHLKKKK